MSKWDQAEQGRAAARLMRMAIASGLILFSLVLIVQALMTSTLPSRSPAQPQKNSDPVLAALDEVAREDNPKSANSKPTNLFGYLIRTNVHLLLPAIIGLLVYPWGEPGKTSISQAGLPQVPAITPPITSPPPLSPPKSVTVPKTPPSQAAPPQVPVFTPQPPPPPTPPPESHKPLVVSVASLAPPTPEPPKPVEIPMVVIPPPPCVVPPIPVGVPAAQNSAVPQWIWWKSRFVLVGGFIVTSDLLFPPWRLWVNNSNVRLSKPGDRHFFFDPPTAAPGWSTEIDYGRLSVEVLAIVGLTVLLLFIRAPRPATQTRGRIQEIK